MIIGSFLARDTQYGTSWLHFGVEIECIPKPENPEPEPDNSDSIENEKQYTQFKICS